MSRSLRSPDRTSDSKLVIVCRLKPETQLPQLANARADHPAGPVWDRQIELGCTSLRVPASVLQDRLATRLTPRLRECVGMSPLLTLHEDSPSLGRYSLTASPGGWSHLMSGLKDMCLFLATEYALGEGVELTDAQLFTATTFEGVRLFVERSTIVRLAAPQLTSLRLQQLSIELQYPVPVTRPPVPLIAA